MTAIEKAEARLQEEIRQNDLGADNGHLLAYWAAYLDGARALQAEVEFYKNIAEEWKEEAYRKDRLLGMYRAQNIYGAKDASGNVITNLCSLNRSESPNSPENPDS